MTTPVPEEVLAEIVANAHGYDPRAELARELLAAREAVRGILTIYARCNCMMPEEDDEVSRLARSLLPETPRE